MKLQIPLNYIVRLLIFSESFINFADGLIAPVFAIFIIGQIEDGNAQVAGFAFAIFWIVKSLVQIPLGKYLDKNHGEKDDFYSMLLGSVLIGAVPFGYIFINTAWQLYLLQIILALGWALWIPPWYSAFSRHLDKFKEAFEWSVRSSILGITIAGAGALSGIIATSLGFNALFIVVGLVSFLTTFSLAFLFKTMVKPELLKYHEL